MAGGPPNGPNRLFFVFSRPFAQASPLPDFSFLRGPAFALPGWRPAFRPFGGNVGANRASRRTSFEKKKSFLCREAAKAGKACFKGQVDADGDRDIDHDGGVGVAAADDQANSVFSYG